MKKCLSSCKAIRCTTTGEEFSSVSEAARCLHLDQGSIFAVCSGRLLTTGGLNFEYVDNSKFNLSEGENFPKKRVVYCCETGITYPSISEASRQTKIHRGTISFSCKNKNLTAGGYHWQFVK